MVTKKSAVKKLSKKPLKRFIKKTVKKASVVKKGAPMKSFKLYKDDKPFTSMQATRQTLYWIILLGFIVLTQLWILKIQMDIVNITSMLVSQ